MIAATNGRRSPNTTASAMYGLNLSLFSTNCGANGVPSASLPTSLARSTMTRWPRRSIKPESPVRNQPSSVIVSRVDIGLLVVALEHPGRADQHLAILGDTHLGARNEPADRIRVGLAVRLQRGEAGKLGRAPDLL